MTYGPIIERFFNTQPGMIRNLAQEPSNINNNIQAKVNSNVSNFGKFMPDIAGVSFGSQSQNLPWHLVPAVEWDMLHLPGY